jgi:uncharacterized protein YuzE
MAAKLAVHYDRDADILYLTSRHPYPEQETEELGDDVICRVNPQTGDIESLEILFFSRRRPRELLELPVIADFRRA